MAVPSFASVLAQVLVSTPEPIATLAIWHARHRALAQAHEEPILAAIAAGAGTDRLAWAFGSGYQCAGRSLFGLEPGRLGALCATERGGAHPRAIETRLTEGALYGEKCFVTFGLEAEALIVIASEGTDADGRNRLRAVQVDRSAGGLTFEPLPETPFVPEISHARLRLDGTRGLVLDGDGYLDFLKPFRTIEDTHVFAAALAHMVTLANAAHFDDAFREHAAALLASLVEIARMPPLAPATHLALSGAQAGLQLLVDEIDRRSAELPSNTAALWTRDRPLFSVAEKARRARRQAAWSSLR